MTTIRLAKITFIADSNRSSFWGSNETEQQEIDQIRREFRPYLHNREGAPTEMIERLGAISEKIFDAIKDPELRDLYKLYL
jgi:hypothetical protein